VGSRIVTVMAGAMVSPPSTSAHIIPTVEFHLPHDLLLPFPYQHHLPKTYLAQQGRAQRGAPHKSHQRQSKHMNMGPCVKHGGQQALVVVHVLNRRPQTLGRAFQGRRTQ